MTDLDLMHDIILDAIGVSYNKHDVAKIMSNLSVWIKHKINESGIEDTEVREMIGEHLNTLF